MSEAARISFDDLVGDQRQLAELIGLDQYLRIVEIFGGSSIYIRKMDSLLHNERDRSIYSKFDGYNFRELGIEFNLSERAIRSIVSDIMQEVRTRPMVDQIAFEDWK